MTQGQDELLRNRVAGYFLPRPPDRLAVAVSGGSDSLALLVLLADWAKNGGPEVSAVTIDHGLRANSAAEAEAVAAHCAGSGIKHDCVKWTDWDGTGNLPDQARRARYRLLAEWAEAAGIGHVALGHTADDQAETFLMRLSREAGVDGLSAMSATRRQGRVVFCRPALRITRQELRDVLTSRGLGWIDDPTNADEAYERVRARQVMAALAPLGISAENLSAVAHHMRDVRETLYWYVFLAARDVVEFQGGDILFDRRGFRVLQREVARRLVQASMKWINSAEYGPRGRALDLLMESIRGGTNMTLQGCHVLVCEDRIQITREYNAVAQLRAPVHEVWDARWHVTGPECSSDIEIAALGSDGLRQCPDWREIGLPEASQMSGPAIWRGDELLAAPLAGMPNGWKASLINDSEYYFAALLSH